ncbi:MAG: TIGR01777 family oxidoreductase [Chloroflexi bacterium]|nr:TIGR01777 family oxidoreductase [Chloroflexota bacterium]
MGKQTFIRKVDIDSPAQELFGWHERPGAFNRLTPPWETVEVKSHTGGIRNDARVDLRVSIGPFKQRWLLRHEAYEYGKQFKDVLVKGPFATYEHTHLIHNTSSTSSQLEDRIEYSLPLGALGELLGGWFARSKFERVFRYRHAVTRNDLKLHSQYSAKPRLNVAITGSSGMVGSALRHFLTTGGHKVTPIVRHHTGDENAVLWQPLAGEIDSKGLEDVNAVVHLAGESIGDERWTAARKKRILESRIKGTRLLAETLANMANPPGVLVSASAIGYYSSRHGNLLDENSDSGDDFLAEVVREWEAALQPAVDAGMRVVILRFGVMLTLAGGMLARLHLPFRMGAGSVIGSGEQYLSWTTLDDVLGVINHSLLNDDMGGTYNAVTPNPVTNKTFTHTMGKVMHRPTLVPLPAFAIKWAFGEMGDSLLLANQKVSSQKLQDSGYEFLYPEIEEALRHVLGRCRKI